MEQGVAFGRIGEAFLDQRLDQRDHFRDVARRARLLRRRQGAEHAHVLLICLGRAYGQRADGLAGLCRCLDDLVVHIGEVADIGDMLVAVNMAQQPEQDIEHHHRPCVADMGEVIDRGSADIHPDLLGIDRRKRFLAAGQCVVEMDRHGLVLQVINGSWQGKRGPVSGLRLHIQKIGKTRLDRRIRSGNNSSE